MNGKKGIADKREGNRRGSKERQSTLGHAHGGSDRSVEFTELR